MALRTCRVCGLEAHAEEDLQKFKKDKRRKYGRENFCLECKKKQSAAWRKANPGYGKGEMPVGVRS